ncbi:tRNA dihydrouridine synthase, partial [Spiromyces aspiralis]
VKEAVRVPVFANGNILYFEDVQRCIDATGVDGVMSAETNLYNPALFSGKVLPVWQLADEYLEICREVPTKINYIRAHLFKLYRQCLPQHTDIREQLAKARDLAEMSELAQTLKQRLEEQAKITEYDPSRIVVDEYGYRVYPPYICQPAIRRVFDKHNSTGEAPLGRQVYEENAVRLRDLECAQSLVATGGPSIPQQQQPDAKSEKRPNSSDNSEEGTANTSKKPKADKAKALKKKSACLLCHNNASAKCPRLLCKNCCREISQKLANHNAAELPTLPENNTRQVPFDWTSAAIPADCEAHGSRKTGASCFSESTPA